MKVGIVGGIGPASTLDYYTGIINGYRQKIDEKGYPSIVIDSINMTGMLNLVLAEDWDGLVNLLLNAIISLKNAGATYGVIASNTPHLIFEQLAEKSPLPLISIVEETCIEAKRQNLSKVVLFGTIFTMKRSFYADNMRKYGIELIVPTPEEQQIIHNIIFPNLEDGIVIPEQKERMLNLADEVVTRENAQALILGCTELPLMIKPNDLKISVLDTTRIHINAIVNKFMR